jgi:hypothetical protein
MSPSISKEGFESLGFYLAKQSLDQNGGIWSVRYKKYINPNNEFDHVEIFWFNGTNRYEIRRQTERLKNIFLFEGFLNSIEDLKFLLSLFDLSFFYEADFPRKPLNFFMYDY